MINNLSICNLFYMFLMRCCWLGHFLCVFFNFLVFTNYCLFLILNLACHYLIKLVKICCFVIFLFLLIFFLILMVNLILFILLFMQTLQTWLSLLFWRPRIIIRGIIILFVYRAAKLSRYQRCLLISR